jgi:hypothetical protein
MTTRAATLLATLLTTGLSGCATTEMTVKRVPTPPDKSTAEPNGIRYSLPKPFLLVTPAPEGDGSMKVEVVYLPDECQTYAIDAKTKRGQYDLTVTVKEGLLSKIIWTAKGAELAAQAAETGGELLKSEFARIEQDKKDKQAKADEAKKTADTEVKTLEKELADKQLAMNLAALELADAQAVIDAGNATEDDRKALRKAQLEFNKAQASRDFAQTQLDDARSRAAALPSAMNKAQEASDKGPATPVFWSPVLYAIDDNAGNVGVRAVEWKDSPAPTAECSKGVPKTSVTNHQKKFETNAVPKEPEQKEEAPKVLGSTHVVRIWKSGALRHTIVLDKPVNGLNEPDRQLRLVEGTTTRPVTPVPYQAVLASDRQSIRIEFPGPPSSFNAGTYQIIVPFTYGKDKATGEAQITLTVQK